MLYLPRYRILPGQRVETRSSLARGLTRAWTFDSGVAWEAAHGEVTPVTAPYGAPSFMPMPYSRALGLYTPNGAAASLGIGDDWYGAFTVIWQCRVESVDNPWGGLWFKSRGGANHQGFVQRNSSNDRFLIVRGASSNDITAKSLSSFLNRTVTFAMVSAGPSSGDPFALYADGLLVQAFTPADVQIGGAGPVVLGAEPGLSATYDSSVYWSSMFRFDRALSEAEIARIGTLPREQLIRSRRIWVPVSAGGGGAITIDATTGNAVAAGVTGVAGVAATINGVVGNATAAGITGTVSVDLSIAGVVGNAVAAGVTGAPAVSISIDGVLGNAVAAGVPGVPGVSIEIAGTVGNAVAAGVAGLAEVGGSISIDGVVGNAVAAGVAGSPGVAITITGNVGNAVAAGVSGLAAIGILIDGNVGNAVAAGTTGALSLDIVVPGVVGNAVAAGVTGTASIAGTGTGATAAEIVAAIMAEEIEPGVSVRMALRVILAAASGTTDGLGSSTERYYSRDGLVARITATFDGNSNRTSVTLDDS